MPQLGLELAPKLDTRAVDRAAADLLKTLGVAGQQAGRDFADNFERGLRGLDVTNPAKQIAGEFGTAGTRAGREFGDAATSSIRRADWNAAARSSANDFTATFERSAKPKVAIDARATATSAGTDAGEGFSDGFGGAVAGMASKGGAIAAGLAGAGALAFGVGQVIADQLGAGMDSLRAQDLTAARLGLDRKSVGNIAAGAADAFRQAWGESTKANMSTATLAAQGGLLKPTDAAPQIADTIASIEAVNQLIGGDLQETIKTASVLLKAGLAGSATDALDTIAGAYRGVGDLSGDLTDSLSEYASGWANAGLTAKQALALVKQGSDLGVDVTDRSADALREFGRRMAEDGDVIVDALNRIGLDGQAMYQKLQGPQSFQALDEVFDKIRALESPIQKNEIALKLLGDTSGDFIDAFTQWDPSEAVAKFGEIAGASDQTKDAISEHASAWDGLTNSISQTIAQMQTDLANSPVGRFFTTDLPNSINRRIFGPDNPVDEFRKTLPPQPPATPGQDLGSLLGVDPMPGTPGTGLPSILTPDAQVDPRVTAPAPVPIPTPAPPPGAPGTPQFSTPYTPPKTGGPGGSSGGSTVQAPQTPFSGDPTSLLGGLPITSANYSAASAVLQAKHDVAQQQAFVDQLEKSNVATQDEITKAKNDLAEKQHKQFETELRLNEARTNATDKFTKGMDRATTSIAQIGAKLDDDLGISRGLPGLVDNLTRFVGNLALANSPLGGQLAAQMAQQSTSGLGGYAPAYGGYGSPASPFGAPGVAQPGESARDFAHRVEMPYYRAQGLTVGDHAADQYGEHQNGAIDIMVSSFEEGAQVLKQVLADPNTYGAIWNRTSYGYGNGTAGTPMEDRGNPTANHQDHVHALFRPGGQNNITPSAAPTTLGGPPVGPPIGQQPTQFGWGPGGIPSMPPGAGGQGYGIGAPSPGAVGQGAGAPVAPVGYTPGAGGWQPQGGGLGQGIGGAVAAAGSALPFPGAGEVAAKGGQMAERSIKYLGSLGAIGVSGLMQTFLPSGSELGDPSQSWIGKLASGLAQVQPAQPTTAGQTQAPAQPQQHEGSGAPPGPTNGLYIENFHQSPDRNGMQTAKDLAFNSYGAQFNRGH